MNLLTSFLLAAVSVVSVTMFYIFDRSGQFYYEVPLSTAAKLYSTMILVCFNSRVIFRPTRQSTTWIENTEEVTSDMIGDLEADHSDTNISQSTGGREESNANMINEKAKARLNKEILGQNETTDG